MNRRWVVLSVIVAGACGDSTTPEPVPTQLAIITQPSATAQNGTAFSQQPTVELRDSAGAPVAKAGVTVTALAIGAGNLGGTTAVQTGADGRAVFTDLVITGQVGNRTLQFTSTGLAAATSTAIAITAGAASQLAIVTQPADNAQSGVALTRQPLLQIRDASGNDVTQAGLDVVADIASGGGTLEGTATVATNAAGRAQFSGLVLRGTVGARVLTFTSGALPAATSTTVSLAAGPAATLVLTTQPSDTVDEGDIFPRQPILKLQDEDGNDVTQAGVAVTPSVATGPGSLIGGAPVQTSAGGTATFTTLSLVGPGDHTLQFAASGVAPDTSTTITVLAVACSLASPGDNDGDRLPNCVETNTGVYASTLNTGTDPDNADTDGDFIDDGDEVLGTVDGLDLPTMGLNPLRQNILLEYDWFDDAVECAAHSHRPTAGVITMINAAFAAAPNVNPDGTTGITLINDYGQGGVFTGGTLVADADAVLGQGVNGVDFQNYKAANFAANRHGYFHYTLLPHRYDVNSGSSGQAELPGDDLIVSLYCFGSDVNVANTIMHELGHNLLLRHGGDVNVPNYKPNYNSVMNYKYQFPGVDNDCTPAGNAVLDYSRGTRIALDENSLDETQGTCGNPPGPGVDWNIDGDATDVGLVFDINVDGSNTGDGLFQVLTDYNDWANIIFTGLGDGDGAMLMLREIVSCTAVPPEAR